MLYPPIVIIVDVLTLEGVVDVTLCSGVEFVEFFAFPS